MIYITPDYGHVSGATNLSNYTPCKYTYIYIYINNYLLIVYT